MKHILIILNIIAAVWLFFFSPGIPMAADSMRHQQVIDLCRTGVINTTALQSQFPDSASPEGSLSRHLSHSDGYFRYFIWPASALALFNAAMIGMFLKSKPKEQDSSTEEQELTR